MKGYMTRHLAHVAALFFVLISMASAQGPDEKYIHIYSAIQEADGLLSRGQMADAAAKYKEAYGSLKALQEAHPTWSPKVVDYRLNYISSKLEPIQAKLNPPAPTQDTNISSVAIDAGSTNQLSQFKSLQEQIASLTQQNAKLQAQLKEAWSAQPAAADPQELAKAQQTLTELQKERDLLKASLEDAKSKKPEEVTSALEQEQKILAEVRQQLAQQTELVGTLQKENELLKGQVASLKASTPGTDLAVELEAAKTTIAALQATNIALLTENLLLQGQLAEVGKNVMPPPNMKELERERDELRKRLEAAQRQLARRKGDRGENGQLQAALARLEVYETKPVPYTPEELALFKQPDAKLTMSDASSVRKKPRELPPGAGPLMAEAQRAIEAGRFDDAEKKLKEILRQDENNVVVLTHMASVQMEQNRLSEAEKSLTAALASDPEDAASLYMMGRLRLLQEKYDQALDSLSLSAKVVPDDPRTQYWLGKVLIQKGQRIAAETALRRAVQLRPGWGEAHYSLAMVYATQQPPFKELAQWHYQKAITGGYPRNVEFEKMIEEKRVSSQ
jgi:Tfp pilus assembly protein PilF